MSESEKASDLVVVGATSAPRLLRVETGAILRFLDAFGEQLPEVREGLMAPATYPTILQAPAPGLDRIDAARVLHGEQEYRYERPLRPGDELVCVSRVTDVTEKATRLGDVTMVVVETTGRDVDGALVLTERMTLVVR